MIAAAAGGRDSLARSAPGAGNSGPAFAFAAPERAGAAALADPKKRKTRFPVDSL